MTCEVCHSRAFLSPKPLLQLILIPPPKREKTCKDTVDIPLIILWFMGKDPLSPFLFLSIGEVLGALLLKLYENGLYKGFMVGEDKVHVHLLQYANDTLLFCKYDEEKSVLSGVNLSEDELNYMAGKIGCKTEKLPFMYLGLLLGDYPRRELLATVDEGGILFGAAIEKFHLGRPLGQQNQSLAKWGWRLMEEEESLWRQVVRNIHGKELFDWHTVGKSRNSLKGPWICISRAWRKVEPLSNFKLGNGPLSNITFWNDTWAEDAPLRSRFQKLFRITLLPNGSVAAH
ncbi:hypothetical protein E5676_scaffold606G00380 [Cucumis melo var. makuwa]|uniref:Reverse transcriptase domain-containing protein n=1 Tax=Cucumis melo var. makuwa TaxID=1194695 RepID=A0A5D3C5E6_CUCMM|nr:hypothetical protein E5676_scaffold606G00380 [Cucumis melo var. makuwa]